jgi:hypothetical protein
MSKTLLSSFPYKHQETCAPDHVYDAPEVTSLHASGKLAILTMFKTLLTELPYMHQEIGDHDHAQHALE